jgi:phospho-N-acetylmuramoyl-pentapeptide-transferase
MNISSRLYSTKLNVPFFKSFTPDLLIDSLFGTHFWFVAYLPFLAFVAIVIVGSSNTVNLTDGLDGLAIGCTLIASAALTAVTYVTGHRVLSDYLDIQFLPDVAELTIFCGSMVGASLGFLWYNAHPAEVFMGDVGSLALGGAIGTISVVIKQELLLIFIGGVFVAEGLSVMIQVISFKTRGKRVFKMAPLHHHFELIGWSESKVIIRFWIASLILALFSLTTLKLR